jgi:BioD-like phosphotransacetylase family protein
MPILFIGSTGDHAGHSLMTWAIARRLVDRGLEVGFVKPFGTHPIVAEGVWTDRDARLFKEVLNIRESYEQICPYLLSEESWRQKAPEELLDEVKGLARDISLGKDVLLIMGSKQIFFDDTPFPVPEISLISELEADVVLVHRFRALSKSIYSILSLTSLLKERIKGVLFNRVPMDRMEEIRDRVIPSLARKGIPVTAAISEDPFLSYRSLGELRDVLDGELLCGEEGLQQSVGGMTVGSVDLNGELRIFKRAYNKIVLLKPGPLDGPAEDPTTPRPVAGILLTGGRKPAPLLREAAENAGIALIVVKDDAFAVLERLEKATPYLSPKDDVKVRHFEGLLDHDGSLDRLIDSLKPAS